MRLHPALPVLAAMMLSACSSAPVVDAPGATSRTLSRQEVTALLQGQGMAMAAPAEINGYPGPVHVLELKEALELTPDQRFATSRLVGLVQGRARALGQRIVNAEKRLDADMAEGKLGPDLIRARLETIAALRAQLRFTHINAHLEQKRILSPEQLARYYELRGRSVRFAEPAMPPAVTEPLALPATMPVEPKTAPSAVKHASEPANAPPAYPFIPLEEHPQPPAMLLEEPPRSTQDASDENDSGEKTPSMTPGMQDAMELAEPGETK